MALFDPMMALSAISTKARVAILSVLLLTVATSSVPLIEVHAHEESSFGHNHAPFAHEHAPDHGHGVPAEADESEQSAKLHVHNLNAPALTLFKSFQIEGDTILNAHTEVPLIFRPPDAFITPLFRPPIA